MLKYKNIILLFIILVSLILIIYYFYNFINTDEEFVNLIKNMAIKNHKNPTLFIEKYNNAVSEEEKLKIILTNKFYECIHNNNKLIKTKLDVNLYCGHIIKF